MLSAAIQRAARHRRPSSKAMKWLLRFGGVGLFFVAIVDSSVIPLPLPGSTDVFLLLLASREPEWWWALALTSIAGAIIGGYASYRLAARGGEALLRRLVPERMRGPVSGWVQRNAFLSIGLPALLPPPIPLTPFVIASGALNMPKRKFLVAFTSARTVRYFLVAWLAQHYGKHIVRMWQKYLGEYTEPVIWGLVAITVVGGVFFYIRFRQQQRAPIQAARSEPQGAAS